MRAVFINACHPDTAHVCGMRARAFADALAAMGHRIVLLTPPLEESGTGTEAGSLPRLLATHDWSRPCRVAAPFASGSVLPALRTGRCPAGLRHALIAAHFLRHGSVFEDWCAGARPLLPIIAKAFGPDVVWGVFGNTGCWRVAQELARRAGCPWVADVKDSWTAFVPAPFRGILARRFGDAGRMTALSAAHAGMMRRWMPALPAAVVYSGIPREFLALAHDAAEAESATKEILLCGSLYDRAAVETVFSALARWLESRSTEADPPVHVAYAGADGQAVASAARPLDGLCRVEILGRLPLDRLQERQKQAVLNLHLPFAPALFHHKLFELLAAGRPVLSFPGESAEARRIAAAIGARLICCDDRDELERAFSATLGDDAPAGAPLDTTRLAAYSWDEQAKILADVLKEAIGPGTA